MSPQYVGDTSSTLALPWSVQIILHHIELLCSCAMSMKNVQEWNDLSKSFKETIEGLWKTKYC